MPVTRSATHASATIVAASAGAVAQPKTSKRKASAPSKARSSAGAPANPGVAQLLSVIPPAGPPPAVVPATLSFSFEDAKRHLIGADERFRDVFEEHSCRPFEKLEEVEPFRTLVTSILGQQISWLAARAICHRFIRLYNPSLPERPTEESRDDFFPTAQQVASTDTATLKAAGLSTRKAEYVSDLAARFADGRLSTQKLVEANDEELYEMLIEVRGIGKWTVDMFAIFSLRRPNILPVGDLGVQRGVCRWFLSLYAPKNQIMLSPDEKAAASKSKAKKGKKANLESDIAKLQIPTTPKRGSPSRQRDEPDPTSLTTSFSAAEISPAFTPSIAKTLNRELPKSPAALPEGLTPAILKSRLTGKKIKGAILTSKEMEELTQCWEPYRSLGVYYMWSIAEVLGNEE